MNIKLKYNNFYISFHIHTLIFKQSRDSLLHNRIEDKALESINYIEDNNYFQQNFWTHEREWWNTDQCKRPWRSECR